MLQGVAASSEAAQVAIEGGLTGWLEKQADWKLQWNKRLMTIKDRTISYRVKDDAPDKNCARLQALQKYAGQERTFRIWTERGECWLLRAPTEESYKQWTGYMEAALTRDDAEIPKLKGVVEKRMQWTGQWKSRYVVVDGVELRYAEKEGEHDKRRYVVVAADRCVNECEIRITASNGDAFHIRLATKQEAELWHSTLSRCLEHTTAFRWQAVEVEGDRRDKGFLNTVFHSATLIDDHHILVFGGISSTMPTSANKPCCGNEVVCLSLWGSHPCETMPVQPFEEGPGAKVRPNPRESAASTVIDGTWYIHGGTNEQRAVFNDMWCIRMGDVAGRTMKWERLFSPSKCPFPARFGHSMVSISGGGGSTGDAALIVMIGGFGATSGDAAIDEIIVFDPQQDRSGGGGGGGIVDKFPCGVGRGYHSACVVEQPAPSILVVGGCTKKGETLKDMLPSGVASVLNIDLATRAATEVSVLPPLPPLISPGLTQRDGEIFLLGGSGEGLPQLYSLRFSGPGTITARRVECLGDSPRMHYGMSLFPIGSYLYAVGDCAVPPFGPAVERAMLPRGDMCGFASGSTRAFFAPSAPPPSQVMTASRMREPSVHLGDTDDEHDI